MAPSVRLTARATRDLGNIPAIWRPSAMYGSSTQSVIAGFQAIPGPRGIVRMTQAFGASQMASATSLSDYIARVTAYCSQPEVAEAIGRGTAIFEVNGTPLYLSSTADATVLGGSGWPTYRAAKPADLSDGGAWQVAMQALVDVAMNTFHFRAPRNPSTGRVEIGRPGVLFEFWNEPSFPFFFGPNGQGALGDWLLAYRRFVAGARAANPDVAFGGPVVAGYQSLRTDLLYATTSADILAGGRSAGGTEGTGRFLSQPLRSYFLFDVSNLADAAISSAVLKTTNAGAVGTISSDSWAYRPYNTNGQGDPAIDSDATAFARCGSGTAYVSGDTTWRTTGARSIELGATAGSHVRAAIPGANYTVSATMTAEASGADRYANPLGFNDATQSNRPQLEITYQKTMIEIFCDYAAANAIAPDVIIFHNFQISPSENVSAAASLIATALSNAGLASDTPKILTEYQNGDAAQIGVRDDYRCASYTLGTIYEHWQAGFSAMCQVMLKLGAAPSNPNLFTDEWGMVTNGTVNGSFVSVPSFMAVRLLSQWRDLGKLIPDELSDSSYGIRRFSARSRESLSVVAARWDPSGPATVDLEVRAVGPGRPLRYADVYRFTSTINNPVSVFNTTSGTYAQKVAAALAAGEAAVAERRTGSKFTVTLGQYDSLVAQFFYAPAAKVYPAEPLTLDVESVAIEPAFKEIRAPELPAEPAPEPIPAIQGQMAARMQLSAVLSGAQKNPYAWARQRLEDELLLLGEL